MSLLICSMIVREMGMVNVEVKEVKGGDPKERRALSCSQNRLVVNDLQVHLPLFEP